MSSVPVPLYRVQSKPNWLANVFTLHPDAVRFSTVLNAMFLYNEHDILVAEIHLKN
jgi:hypothetical protein